MKKSFFIIIIALSIFSCQKAIEPARQTEVLRVENDENLPECCNPCGSSGICIKQNSDGLRTCTNCAAGTSSYCLLHGGVL